MATILWLCGLAWAVAWLGTLAVAIPYPRIGIWTRFTWAAKLSITLNISVSVFGIGGCVDGDAWTIKGGC